MEDRLNVSSPEGITIDYNTIIFDVLREWRTVLMIVVSAGLLTYVLIMGTYRPRYATKTTLVVTATGTYNDIYNNLRTASGSAGNLSKMLNSSVLRTMIAKEMGLESFHGTTQAEIIEDSNLLVLTVEAETPEISFNEMKGILDNYSILSDDLLGNIHLTILEPPKANASPVNSVNPVLTASKVMLVAAAAAILILAILSMMRDTIRTSRDVERKLDTKHLATIHMEKKNRSLLSGFRKDKTSILITNPTTSFRYVETLKKLATRTANLMRDRKARSILISSVTENEGKSTVSANLALALAQEGARILMIDADFRKPSLYKVLNMSDTEFLGLSEYLLEKGEDAEDYNRMVKQIPGSAVSCILNKTAMPQTMEMLSSGKMRALLKKVKEDYDFIIVDTSPMQLVADAEELAEMTDVSMIIVRQHYMEAKVINDKIDSLNGKTHRLIGCVFNYARTGRLGSVGSYAYGYGYGRYGYGYGGHYGKRDE